MAVPRMAWSIPNDTNLRSLRLSQDCRMARRRMGRVRVPPTTCWVIARKSTQTSTEPERILTLGAPPAMKKRQVMEYTNKNNKIQMIQGRISGDAPWRQAVNKGPVFPSVSVCLCVCLYLALSRHETPWSCACMFQPNTSPLLLCSTYHSSGVFPVDSGNPGSSLGSQPTPASDAWYKSSKTFWLEGSKLSKPAFTSVNTRELGQKHQWHVRSVGVIHGDTPPNEANDVVGEGMV